jgi:hypothetical protein
MKIYGRGETFVTSALDGGDQFHTPVGLSVGKGPPIHVTLSLGGPHSWFGHDDQTILPVLGIKPHQFTYIF